MTPPPPECPCCRDRPWSRREFVRIAAAAAAGTMAATRVRAADPAADPVPPLPGLPIIDIHQHCTYVQRPDDRIPIHQHNNGVKLTIILPGGTSGGLAAGAAGTEHCREFVRRQPAGRYVYFGNENVFRPEAPKVIDKYLREGAIGIGELKDPVACDSQGIRNVAALARDRGVPILMHFQNGSFNDGFARFYRIIEEFPTVKFIAHAQTFWANIDKNYQDSQGLSPSGPVTPGGLSDRWLADYPNFYGDLSAASGNRALARDEEFSRGFLVRHQDKLMFGSDCSDWLGYGPTCWSHIKLGLLKKLCSSEEVLHKLLFRNARRIIPLPA